MINPRNLLALQDLPKAGQVFNGVVLQSSSDTILFQFPASGGTNLAIGWTQSQPTLFNDDDFDDVYFDFTATWMRPAEFGYPIIWTNAGNGTGSNDFFFTNTLGAVSGNVLAVQGDSLTVSLRTQSNATGNTATLDFVASVSQLDTGSLNVIIQGTYKEF